MKKQVKRPHYGKRNPLRLALPLLRRHFPLVIPQRGGIWVGSDCWVTYGTAGKPFIVVCGAKILLKDARARAVRRVMKALDGLDLIEGEPFDL